MLKNNITWYQNIIGEILKAELIGNNGRRIPWERQLIVPGIWKEARNCDFLDRDVFIHLVLYRPILVIRLGSIIFCIMGRGVARI